MSHRFLSWSVTCPQGKLSAISIWLQTFETEMLAREEIFAYCRGHSQQQTEEAVRNLVIGCAMDANQEAKMEILVKHLCAKLFFRS
jgi:hypothetical protein